MGVETQHVMVGGLFLELILKGSFRKYVTKSLPYVDELGNFSVSESVRIRERRPLRQGELFGSHLTCTT